MRILTIGAGVLMTLLGVFSIANAGLAFMGHSSRDTLRSLVETGVRMEQKPFSIGVRVEHPQEMVDKAQYGDAASNQHLPHAIYKLAHHCEDGRGVYTFCMSYLSADI